MRRFNEGVALLDWRLRRLELGHTSETMQRALTLTVGMIVGGAGRDDPSVAAYMIRLPQRLLVALAFAADQPLAIVRVGDPVTDEEQAAAELLVLRCGIHQALTGSHILAAEEALIAALGRALVASTYGDTSRAPEHVRLLTAKIAEKVQLERSARCSAGLF